MLDNKATHHAMEGDEGTLRFALRQIKTAMHAAMRGVGRDKFVMTFKRGDRFIIPGFKGDENCHHVLMTTDCWRTRVQTNGLFWRTNARPWRELTILGIDRAKLTLFALVGNWNQLAQHIMKCNSFSLVAATPDAMVNSSLRPPTVHHCTKATNS